MYLFNDSRKVEIKGNYDVVVVGGGIAGVAAAVSASRNGAKTVLLEKQVNLGGLATVGLISWYEPLCDGNGNQMSKGIAEELLRLSIKYGFDDLPEIWGGNGKSKHKDSRFATHFSPTLFSLALDDFLRLNGVEIHFDTMATYPAMENNICKGIVAETVSGKEFFSAKVVIDATGTASICSQAGISVVTGENYCIYIAHGYDNETLAQYNSDNNILKLRKWYACGGDMTGKGNFEGVPTMQGVTSDSVNEFLRIGKHNFFEIQKKKNKNSRDLSMIPSMPQFRKIARIEGDYVFDGSEDGIAFENSIGRCGDFRTKGKHFSIPYNCLFNSNYPNIITAGRIISATDDGWEIVRVIPVCALTGEAAGTAAAISVRNGTSIPDTDIKEIQSALAF